MRALADRRTGTEVHPFWWPGVGVRLMVKPVWVTAR